MLQSSDYARLRCGTGVDDLVSLLILAQSQATLHFVLALAVQLLNDVHNHALTSALWSIGELQSPFDNRVVVHLRQDDHRDELLLCIGAVIEFRPAVEVSAMLYVSPWLQVGDVDLQAFALGLPRFHTLFGLVLPLLVWQVGALFPDVQACPFSLVDLGADTFVQSRRVVGHIEVKDVFFDAADDGPAEGLRGEDLLHLEVDAAPDWLQAVLLGPLDEFLRHCSVVADGAERVAPDDGGPMRYEEPNSSPLARDVLLALCRLHSFVVWTFSPDLVLTFSPDGVG